MISQLKAASTILLAFTVLLAPQLPAYASTDGSADPAQDLRYSRSIEGRAARASAAAAERDSRLADAQVSEHGALLTEGPRVSPGRALQGKIVGDIADADISKAGSADVDYWFFDADSELFYDLDRDGYFRGLVVRFDADVSDGVADVYAELYLSRNGGPWNLYYTTRVFSIFGASGEDEYEVETELDYGYPSGDYDVLVELYDAYSGEFLTDIGPFDDAALAYLPLEDADRDTPPVYSGRHYGGGGSSSPLLVMFLLLLWTWRQRQRDRQQMAAPVAPPTGPAPRGPGGK